MCHVQATGRQTTVKVTVILVDVNDNTPMFDQLLNPANVSENAASCSHSLPPTLTMYVLCLCVCVIKHQWVLNMYMHVIKPVC